jgi:RNA polymerase sigma-70 factor (ECF subfamily)
MEKTIFQEKLTQYKDMVYRVAYTYLHNQADAEDISQETFLKFYQLPEPFADTGFEKAWLIRVTINACHNLRKSVWYSRRAASKEIPELFSDPTDNLLYEEVFALPERYRVVVLLYYYEEYSIQEIADLTGRKLSTIQTQLARARKKLKLALTEQGRESYEQGTLPTGYGSNPDVRYLRAEDSTAD